MKTKIPLSARGHIDCVDAGLSSIAGAQDLITKITGRRVVTKLILSHNELSDDGCIVLFAFLSSAIGKKYHVEEINLNSNNIGDRGLAAIASYLIGNTHLKELYLQSNNFTSNPELFLSFSRAVNQSKLRILSLALNHSLSDAFSENFFPAVNCQTLEEVHLSSIEMTSHSVPFIAGFIGSPRCRLHTLILNGNHFCHKGLKEIIETIEHANSNLLSVELQMEDAPDGTHPNETLEWKSAEADLKRTLTRNQRLKGKVEKEALDLLIHSRPILLHPSPLPALPTNLQLRILSALAPTLSQTQRDTIFSYASEPVHLSTKAKVCMPDPANSMMSVWALDNAPPRTSGCASGKCMGGAGSVMCHRMKERTKWLEEVRCTAFDPSPTAPVSVT